MFKIICNIEKVTLTNYPKKIDLEKDFGIRYTNCHPYKFSDYQLDGKSNPNPKLRFKKAWETVDKFNNLGFDIAQEEYKYLYDKIALIYDFAEYRYIGIFDESYKYHNFHEINTTWIYSTIIRLSLPDPTANFIGHLGQSVISLLTGQTLQKTENNMESFRPIWDERPLLVPEGEVLPKGIVAKSVYDSLLGSTYYAIDEYFLYHLYDNQLLTTTTPLENQDSYINHNNDSISISEQIYNDYVANIQKYVGLKLLHGLDKIRICLEEKKDNDNFLIYPTLNSWLLKPTKDLITDDINNKIALCSSIEGVLFSIDMIIEMIITSCTSKDTKQNFNLYAPLIEDLHNDIYNLNCDNLKTTIESIGDINDYYSY